MMYFFNLWLALQIFYNLQCILNMAFYTERQSFQSLQKQEGVERRKRSSGITKKDAINGVVDNITLADLVEWQMQKANEYVI